MKSRTRHPKRSRPSSASRHVTSLPDAHTIDALYGLEPAFEPGAPHATDARGATQSDSDGDSALSRFISISCPYCGEAFETLIDLSAGSAAYTEDCQICCQPIEIALRVDDSGALAGVSAQRAD